MKHTAIMRNTLRPGYAAIIAGKVITRATESRRKDAARSAAVWASESAVDPTAFCSELAPELWEETLAFEAEFRIAAASKLASLGVRLGTGDHYPLLYFLGRLLRPSAVIETGVAAGFSSAALLSALHRNGAGRLWSSDFPYFRLENPEQYIGCLVAENLRGNWRLLTGGDRVNLPMILNEVPRVDLVHYDSDKSFRGRDFAIRRLSWALTDDTVVVIDDIQDNGHFRALASANPWGHVVLKYPGKFVGLTGPGLSALHVL